VNRPFIITVASEKGGVGKTTIATNLAVYLKALHEDLPVTITSFDNHFSVDQMFALGQSPQQSIADLLHQDLSQESVTLGQYGVQYIASSRRLQPPAQPASWLRQRLDALGLDGILILDTRPILDWFTEAALLAADLVLAPIKDRAALFNVQSLQQVLTEVDRADKLWLVPSLVDSRAKLNPEMRVHEFLRYAAGERDYQLFDGFISKSPKVEGLASGFSSRIRPILTHARNTAVHGQFKALAEFALQQRAAVSAEQNDLADEGAAPTPAPPQPGRRRHLENCPVCNALVTGQLGHFFFDMGSRRRGHLHPDCLEQLLDGLDLESFDVERGFMIFALDGPGLVELDCRLTVHLCDAEENLMVSEGVNLDGRVRLSNSLSAITGQPLDNAYRELVLLQAEPQPAANPLPQEQYRQFAAKRRRVLRELRDSGLV